jgi:hypothetical protein
MLIAPYATLQQCHLGGQAECCNSVPPRLSNDHALTAAHLSAQRSKRAGYFVLLKLVKGHVRSEDLSQRPLLVSELYAYNKLVLP